jgi:hypothetical protein
MLNSSAGMAGSYPGKARNSRREAAARLLVVLLGFACFFIGLSGVVAALALVTVSGAFTGTTLGGLVAISLDGASCRVRTDISPAASARHAARAATVARCTILRRA